jgi:hypothetical protein
MLNYITSYLNSNVTPGQAGNVFWAFVYIMVVFAGISLAVVAMNWLERKALAHMQVRLGPMRVGPHGLLQPIADAIKLLLKEDIIPERADKAVFWAAPFMVVMAAFTTYRCAFRTDPRHHRHEHRDFVHAGSVVAGRAWDRDGGVGVKFKLPVDGSAALQRTNDLV